MNSHDLHIIKSWFETYCASFSTPVPEDQRNITVKQLHSHEVCLNAVRIAHDLRMDEHDALLAETLGLLHDVGRFTQYERYKTFDDAVSVNHAALGAKVLIDAQVLHDLPEQERDLIVHCVTLHNIFTLPPGLDDRTRLFAKLVRDADKLDIWRVFLEYYAQSESDKASAVALGLPDEKGYSSQVLAHLKKGSMISKSELTTLNDFKLLQLSWVFDLNFPGSFRIVQERGTIDKLASVLPRAQEISEAIGIVRAHMRMKLADERP